MATKRPIESEQWTQFLESSSDESDEDNTCFEDSLQQLRALLGARYKVITCLLMDMLQLQGQHHLDSIPAMLQTSDDHGAEGQQSCPPEPLATPEAAAQHSEPQGAKAGRKRKATGPPEPVSEAASRRARAPAGKRKVQQASDTPIRWQLAVAISLPVFVLHPLGYASCKCCLHCLKCFPLSRPFMHPQPVGLH